MNLSKFLFYLPDERRKLPLKVLESCRSLMQGFAGVINKMAESFFICDIFASIVTVLLMISYLAIDAIFQLSGAMFVLRIWCNNVQ